MIFFFSTGSKAMEKVHSNTSVEGHASAMEETLSRALEPGDYMSLRSVMPSHCICWKDVG